GPSQYTRACPAGHRDGRRPDIAGRATHVHRLPGTQPAPGEPGQVRGSGRVGHGHGQIRAHALGHAVEPVDWHGGELGERSLTAVVPEAVAPDAVTWSKRMPARAGGDDLTRQIAADDERERDRRGITAAPD